MKNKEKRSFICIVSVGFCLTEFITPSPFLAFLALERNDDTLPDTENDNNFTHIVPNYNNQEPFSYNTIIWLFVVCCCMKIECDINEMIGRRSM